ncbi:MAG: ribosomal protein small subunit ribosomal protein [Candidatus Parcubacteria bacterium]|jgi:small subunit ribosomal protein S5
MMDEQPLNAPAATPSSTPAPRAAAPNADARSFHLRGNGGRGGNARGGRGGAGGRPRGPRPEIPEQSDYEEKNLEVARVTRVTKGGKRMRFRVLSIIGNRKGRVGFGVGKGVDVASATAKAVAHARKGLITVPFVHDTIPHAVYAKFVAADILIKPAPKGSGIKAGGAVRQVLELAGVPNAVSKILGSANKINNVKATFKALKQLRAPAAKPADAVAANKVAAPAVR